MNGAPLSYASPTQINAYLPLDATPEVLISTLEDGYLTIWATGLGANSRNWYVPNHSDNSRSESRVWKAAYSTVDWRPAGLAFIK